MLRVLWIDMDRGGFSAAQATQVLKFNGKLFKDAGASGYSLLLEPGQIEMLLGAARANWREVEPDLASNRRTPGYASSAKSSGVRRDQRHAGRTRRCDSCGLERGCGCGIGGSAFSRRECLIARRQAAR